MYILSTAVVFAFAGLSAAQSLAGLPSCALSCVTNSLPSNCNLDPKCICESASFISGVACCVSTACDKDGQDAALTYAKSICQPAGVTDLPSSATCAPGQGNGTSSTSGSESGSASATASDASASASATASGASASASSATSAAGASASSATSAAASSATAASGAGAVVYVKGVGLGMGVGLLGVAALL